MGMSISLALTWILFLGLFPMAFFWLRRAWRILVRHDHSEVALKGGEPPAEPARYAMAAGLINLLAGGVAVVTVLGVAVWQWPYDRWTALAGTTIWCKLFIDFAMARHAHWRSRAQRQPRGG